VPRIPLLDAVFLLDALFALLDVVDTAGVLGFLFGRRRLSVLVVLVRHGVVLSSR